MILLDYVIIISHMDHYNDNNYKKNNLVDE